MRNWIRENEHKWADATHCVLVWQTKTKNLVDGLSADWNASIDLNVSSFNLRRRKGKETENWESLCLLKFCSFKGTNLFCRSKLSLPNALRFPHIYLLSRRVDIGKMILSCLIDRNECSMYRNTRAMRADTCDILDRVEWPQQMKMAYNWHLMKRIVTLFYLFCFFFFVSFVGVSLIYCWLCAMEYAPRARVQHLYYFMKTRTARQLKYFVWFVVCVLQTHVCHSRSRRNGGFCSQGKLRPYGNDSLCHVFLGPKLFLRNI